MRVHGPRALASLRLATAAVLVPGALFAESGTYQAHHRPAPELARLVGFSLRAEAPALTADEKTNAVVMQGSSAALAAARARLGELDRAPAALAVTLTCELDGKPLWTGTLSALSGVTARLDAGVIRGALTATVVHEGYDLRTNLDVLVDGARAARVAAGARPQVAPCELARVGVAGWRTLVVRAQVAPAAASR